jgi:hypothetical protein
MAAYAIRCGVSGGIPDSSTIKPGITGIIMPRPIISISIVMKIKLSAGVRFDIAIEE